MEEACRLLFQPVPDQKIVTQQWAKRFSAAAPLGAWAIFGSVPSVPVRPREMVHKLVLDPGSVVRDQWGWEGVWAAAGKPWWSNCFVCTVYSVTGSVPTILYRLKKLQTICIRRDYISVADNLSLIPFLVQLVANFGHSSHFAATFCFLASTPAKDIDLTHHCQPAELNKSAVKIPNVKPSVGANT